MKSFKEYLMDEACWKGYKQAGMKKKAGKTVPNCIPESEEINEIKDDYGTYEIRTHMKYGRDGNSEVPDGYMVYKKDRFRPEDHFYRKSDAVKAIKAWIEQDKLEAAKK